MVLKNSEMDLSDDDHSFELIDSDDLHTDKTDSSDNESFELLLSEELNSGMGDIEESASAGDKTVVNESESSAAETGYTFTKDEQMVDDGDSDEISGGSEKSSAGRKYSLDPSVMIEADNDETNTLEYECFESKTVTYKKADGTILYNFPANIKLKEDMEIKDVAKDHVLPFLPAKSLMRFRSVSKEWDQWIASPFLAHKQSCNFRDISGFFCEDDYMRSFLSLDQSAYGIPDPYLRFLPENVKIRSSCNGLLLCQAGNGENMYYVCNPANNEFHVLPRSNDYHGEEPNLVLAFEPSSLNFSADYQVICAFDLFNGPPMLCFEIYSSETMSWRRSTADCAEFGYFVLKENGFYANGVAYWETSSGELLAFDLKNEICGVQPIPCEKKAEGILTLMNGEVSYVQAYIPSGGKDDDNTFIIEILGGVDMCLKHRIDVDLNFNRRANIQGCRVLLSVNSNIFIFYAGGVIYSYSENDKKVSVIKSYRGMYRSSYSSESKYIPYVNSLVSLPRSSTT